MRCLPKRREKKLQRKSSKSRILNEQIWELLKMMPIKMAKLVDHAFQPTPVVPLRRKWTSMRLPDTSHFDAGALIA